MAAVKDSSASAPFFGSLMPAALKGIPLFSAMSQYSNQSYSAASLFFLCFSFEAGGRGMFDSEAVDERFAGAIPEVVAGLLDEGLCELFAGFAEGLAEYASGDGYGGRSERTPDGESNERGEAHASDREGRLADCAAAWVAH